MPTVGIIGCGSLGSSSGKFLAEQLCGKADVEIESIWNRSANDRCKPLEALPCDLQNGNYDLIIEVSHPSIAEKYGEIILKHADFFLGSPTALASRRTYDRLLCAATDGDRRIFVPRGALWGSEDIHRMAKMNLLQSLTITMCKHPSCFKLAPPLFDLNAQAADTGERTILYDGSLRRLCALAPNNVNSMAAAALAAPSLGFDAIRARIIADCSLSSHVIELEALGTDGLSVRTIRDNPAKTGSVTGSATYASFYYSLLEALACNKTSGLHVC